MGKPTPYCRILGLSLVFAGMLPAVAAAAPTRAAVEPVSQGQLEQRLKAIDSQLQTLASFSMRTGVGGVGYRSAAHQGPNEPEWIQIDLGKKTAIDEIVLVPTIWRGKQTGFCQDGFPEEFRILAGDAGDPHGTQVAAYTASDQLLPRIAPVVIPCAGITASWVRVEATRLSPRAWDQLYDLQMAEVLIFSGEEDVALHQAIQVSSHGDLGLRIKEKLVDGFMPYLMDSGQGDQSIAFIATVENQARPSLTFDLGTIRVLNRIHLHAVDTSDNVPQSTPSDCGIPRRLVVESANQSDFSDAVVVTELHANSLFDTGPVNVLRFPDTACRFVRFTAVEPYIDTTQTANQQRFGFAEIEIYSAGRNVVKGIQAVANFECTDPVRSLSALTDGRNFYGTIPATRDWLEQLALRHHLEAERGLVAASLAQSYARQKNRLVWMGWLTVVLAAGIVFIILIDRILRMRQLAGIRERFAADLHDELGADLHAIKLLGEIALTTMDLPDHLGRVLQSSQEIAQRASKAVRHCMNMQETNGLHGSLKEDMHWAAERIMAKLEYDIVIEGEFFLQRLKPSTRSDLFFFFKESLVNISRHAEATRFSIRLTADDKEVCMVISDNGCGLPDPSAKGVPKSLKRRARLLGAHVSAGNSENDGTHITLKLPTRRLGFRK